MVILLYNVYLQPWKWKVDYRIKCARAVGWNFCYISIYDTRIKSVHSKECYSSDVNIMFILIYLNLYILNICIYLNYEKFDDEKFGTNFFVVPRFSSAKFFVWSIFSASNFFHRNFIMFLNIFSFKNCVFCI